MCRGAEGWANLAGDAAGATAMHRGKGRRKGAGRGLSALSCTQRQQRHRARAQGGPGRLGNGDDGGGDTAARRGEGER